MRALTIGISALLLASMTGAKANIAPNDPACVRNMTLRVEDGGCAKVSMRERGVPRPLVAQQESTSAPPEGAERKPSSMPQATRQQKMKTCEFGAKDQNLTGQARKTFMTRCLASDDAPAPKPKGQR